MIFVTGCARSGTTLIARMLEACGANLGEAGDFAEHLPFKRQVLKPYLRRCNADPLGQKPLPPDDIDLPPYDSLRADIEAVTFAVDVIKEAKLALVWPRIAEAYPEAKWLIVYRDPKKIAESCMRAPFMNAFKSKAEWKGWAEEYHRRCEKLDNVVDARVISASAVIDDDVEELRDTVEWLGFDFDADAARKIIRKSKWHGG